ncbi:response regulator [Paenibacillus sp. IB182496]|uniref:histidine kinase n=1 Tax=Paenibacillus sabuli TaxID=2772509 RepID=A0A927BP20_9BACL|nr:ATP-binding protein [Paenibacillus sabuli]MBD2844107.1 response regulator [Paenibacillus sabuli]
MATRKLMMIALVFAAVLLGMRLWWYDVHDEASIIAVKGSADLRGRHDALGDQVHALRGEWAFYPGRLLVTEPSAAPLPDPVYVKVPGQIDSAFDQRTSGERLRYGSYRLRLRLDETTQALDYALRLIDIRNASRTFVDGVEIGASGFASGNEDSLGYPVPYQGRFASAGGEIDIVIELADNVALGNAGMRNPVYFGRAELVEAEAAVSVRMQQLLCVVLAVHGLYTLLCYFLGRPNKALLYFTLVVMFAMLSVLSDDERLLYQWLPVSGEWGSRLIFFAYTGIFLLLPEVARHLFPEGQRRFAPFQWLRVFNILYLLVVLLAPYEWVWSTRFLLFWIMVLPPLAIAVYMARIAIWRDPQVVFLLLSSISIVGNVVWATINSREAILPSVFYPVDYILAFLCFGAFWLQRFFRTSRQAQQLAARLQQADRTKDEFLATTSHELRNPLHGMLNIAQSLLVEEHRPQTRDRLQLLLAVGRRMSRMVEELLELTRLKQETVTLQPRPLRLQDVLPGVLDMLPYAAPGKPVRIANRLPGELPPVYADEHRVVQILFNLLHNALKFTDQGMISVDARTGGGYAVVRIKDTGIGMDADLLSRVFEPYEQGESGLDAHGGGFGLGLSICRQLVELQGGTIRARSSHGGGSEFVFTLPLASQPEQEPQTLAFEAAATEEPATQAARPNHPDEAAAGGPAESSHAGDSQGRLLIVDDDPVNLSSLQALLQAMHYEVVCADSGTAALRLLERERFTLIIADVMMPRMSGYALCEAIRRRFTLSELPVLLLTARNQPEDIQAGFRAGANDYVTKPADAAELEARVRALAELQRSVAERLRYEAAWLQAQIQPHFLFNTLNSIAALSDIDTERMRRLLETFGTYLRLSFDAYHTERRVMLSHELQLVRAYLYIEQERFGQRLRVAWELDEKADLLLPPLAIQTLVENAVRHGILPLARGGTVTIRLQEEPGGTQIAVCDDGVGIPSARIPELLDGSPETSRGIGLRNTDRRLRQLYGSGLSIASTPGSGTTVSFFVPAAGEPETGRPTAPL